jgi:hypothetical protein
LQFGEARDIGEVLGHSTRSASNADNMSRKSGFSITGALKRPRIERELPHHPDALGRGHRLKVAVYGALMKAADADRRWIGHSEICPQWWALARSEHRFAKRLRQYYFRKMRSRIEVVIPRLVDHPQLIMLSRIGVA